MLPLIEGEEGIEKGSRFKNYKRGILIHKCSML
jgi:hypothetical protein